jgi:transcriptional regulator NrdR family protein
MCKDCPVCHAETEVTNTRLTRRNAQDAIKRRRECRYCGHRFTTYEVSANTPICSVPRINDMIMEA